VINTGTAARRLSLVTCSQLVLGGLAMQDGRLVVTSRDAASGALLERYTDAALPYLDSFTTWGSILTTWMVTRKILENWLYWLVIDSVSIYLYLDRGLYLTAGLFVLYLIIVLFGYRKWLLHYQATSG